MGCTTKCDDVICTAYDVTHTVLFACKNLLYCKDLVTVGITSSEGPSNSGMGQAGDTYID